MQRKHISVDRDAALIFSSRVISRQLLNFHETFHAQLPLIQPPSIIKKAITALICQCGNKKALMENFSPVRNNPRYFHRPSDSGTSHSPMLEGLRNLPLLEKLDLAKCRQIDDDALKHLAGNPSLKRSVTCGSSKRTLCMPMLISQCSTTLGRRITWSERLLRTTVSLRACPAYRNE